MKKIADNVKGAWVESRVHSQIKRVYKKRYKEKITTTEIKKIWSSYVECEILEGLKVGAIVNLDKRTKIWVKATKLTDNKIVMALLDKGLMYVNGRVKEAKLNFDSSEYVYKIMLETDRFKGDTSLLFTPHQNLRNAVTEGIKKGKLITRFVCQ